MAVEKKSVETQTETPQPIVATADQAAETAVSPVQITSLLKTSITALLWLVNSIQPNDEQRHIISQLAAVADMMDATTRQSNIDTVVGHASGQSEGVIN